MVFNIINPYSLDVTHTASYQSRSSCEAIMGRQMDTWRAWRYRDGDRALWLNELADNLTSHQSTLATLITTDMGKPIGESLREVQKSIDCCRFYAKQGPTIQSAMMSDNGRRFPVGPVLGIMPWNFPLWQLIRFIVPTVSVGNTVVIKPAVNGIRVATHLATIQPSNWPIMDVIMPTDEDASALVDDAVIKGVSFTGSESVGRHIAALAGRALVPCVVELGGSDPFIIFDDANIDEALNHAVSARFLNAGQTCISPKRFLIHENYMDHALMRIREIMANRLVMGNPLDLTTTMGPLARYDIQQRVINQLAELDSFEPAVWSMPAPKTGYFVAPTVVDARSLPSTHPIMREEVFGPVAVLDSFSSTDMAIAKANHSPFGLGASVWSTHTTIIDRCVREIDCGTIAINRPVQSMVNVPFGGWKASGLGVELGVEGALSFTRFKAVCSGDAP